jgi:hypothetical protein
MSPEFLFGAIPGKVETSGRKGVFLSGMFV